MFWRFSIFLVLVDYVLKLAYSLSLYVPGVADVHKGGSDLDVSGAAGLR